MLFENNAENELKNVKLEYGFSFSEHTTYGLGGKAKVAYFPETESQAVAVFDKLKAENSSFTVLGNGSNILASDGCFDGAVISTKNLKGIVYRENRLEVLSGTTVAELLKFCINNGLGGLEYLAGIPATVGGLAVMNGGISSKHIAEDIQKVKIYDGEIRVIPTKFCNFGNKHSIMRDIECIVLSVFLSVSAVPREEIKNKVQSILKNRAHLPKGRNCGCVFKNPESESAGRLIEKTGLKGLAYGGAVVSPVHANFIINNGGCADDVYRLIKIVKNKVYENCGILLEEEVLYIGEFNEFDS